MSEPARFTSSALGHQSRPRLVSKGAKDVSDGRGIGDGASKLCSRALQTRRLCSRSSIHQQIRSYAVNARNQQTRFFSLKTEGDEGRGRLTAAGRRGKFSARGREGLCVPVVFSSFRAGRAARVRGWLEAYTVTKPRSHTRIHVLSADGLAGCEASFGGMAALRLLACACRQSSYR